MKKKYILGVIGGGFMARAVIDGSLSHKFLSPDQISVGEPDETRAAYFRERGIATYTDNRKIAFDCDYLLLAVKPQVFVSVAEELKNGELPVLISIMAGKSKSAIKTSLGNVRIARAMPNLPCSVGEGVTCLDTSDFTAVEREFVFGLFASVGKALETPESLLDAVTGVSGSGPAYVYLFLQSLVKAGCEHGLSEARSKELALQTVKGGVRMVELNPDKSLSELIDAVSSKGGTTVAALDSFRRDDFAGSISRAVTAAVNRAEELSR